jgi:nitrogen fixation protein FixH
MSDRPRATVWPYVPVVMLVAMVGGLLVMAGIAADDPAFAVERDYYAKAVAWDAEREQQRQNQRLGWKLDVETRSQGGGEIELVARLVDGNGQEVDRALLDVEAFHNARAARVLVARLDERDDGYFTALPMTRAGIWELRFTARRGADTFTSVVRAELAPESPQ